MQTVINVHDGTSYTNFAMAFWHPFGPHGRETQKEIIKRKQAEVEMNGWTLWSFQPRRILREWYQELSSAGCNHVFAFCSEGRGAIDPAREGTSARPIDCQSYQFINEDGSIWRPIPKGVRVPHPFRPGKRLASAFVVQRVLYPVEQMHQPSVEWFSMKKGPWCQTRIPTRGEYLIRPGGMVAMRKVSVVLELRSPFLAVLSVDKVTG